MKVVLDLPDWVEGRDISILAGIELVAYKFASKSKWNVKVDRCVNCGECCKNHKKQPYLELDDSGTCIHLVPDGDKYVCDKGPYRGYNCCVGDPILFRWNETGCKITYKEV